MFEVNHRQKTRLHVLYQLWISGSHHAVNKIDGVGRFLLTVRSFYLRLVLVAYSELAWSTLLTVEFWFGLFCLRWKVGWVFFCLRLPIGFGLSTYGSPRMSHKQNDLNCE